jgi:hypothetical protein
MRILILTHPRSGGMSLMNYIQKLIMKNKTIITLKIIIENN